MEECSVKCKNSDSCNFWTWHHKDAGEWKYQCVLMEDYENTEFDINVISGNKLCKGGELIYDKLKHFQFKIVK